MAAGRQGINLWPQARRCDRPVASHIISRHASGLSSVLSPRATLKRLFISMASASNFLVWRSLPQATSGAAGTSIPPCSIALLTPGVKRGIGNGMLAAKFMGGTTSASRRILMIRLVGKTLLHGDVLMWLMKTLLTSGCTNQRGAGHVVETYMLNYFLNTMLN